MSPSPSTRFDADTAIEAVAPGRWAACIDRGWWIVDGPNGGYVAALLLRAMMAEVGDPARAPRSLTIHYLRPPAEGAIEVQTVTERTGRTLTTVSARLVQGGRLMGIALGAFATPRAGFDFEDRTPPELPPPERCPLLRDLVPGGVEMGNRYESRWGLGGLPGSAGPRAVCGGWIRFEQPRIADALAVAAFTDAFPPAVFTRAAGRGGLGPVPTIDLTIHFRSMLPLPGATPDELVAVVFSSSVSRDGFLEEDGEVWSRSGVLLAQSRQLAIAGEPVASPAFAAAR
jgi:acyl-CoA thioesterase